MSYSSPLANPAPFVSTINTLSRESISVDVTTARVTRDAENLDRVYYQHFQIVSELKADTKRFNERWVEVLLQSRDAASAISSWYKRFTSVFLALVSDIVTEQDLKDVVTELNAFLEEELPSSRFQLDAISGLKQEFIKIEELLPQESHRVIEVLNSATGPHWKDVVKQLEQDLVPVKSGCAEIERAFTAYASTV